MFRTVTWAGKFEGATGAAIGAAIEATIDLDLREDATRSLTPLKSIDVSIVSSCYFEFRFDAMIWESG